MWLITTFKHHSTTILTNKEGKKEKGMEKRDIGTDDPQADRHTG